MEDWMLIIGGLVACWCFVGGPPFTTVTRGGYRGGGRFTGSDE